MKTTDLGPGRASEPRILDIRDARQVALLGEAFLRERETMTQALDELSTMHFDARLGREWTALATMEPLPGHQNMDRVERRLLRARKVFFLAACHAHRRN